MRQRLLEGFYLFSRRHAWAILVVATLVALLSLFYIRDLKLDSDFQDLLPPGDPLIQRFNERQSALQGTDALTVLLALSQTPSTPAVGVAQLQDAAERLITALKDQPEVKSASYRPELPNSQALSFNLQALSEENLRTLQGHIQSLSQSAGTAKSPQDNPGQTPSSGPRLDETYAQFNTALQEAIEKGGLAVLDPVKLQETLQAMTQRLDQLSTLNDQVLHQLDLLPGQIAQADAQIDPLLKLAGQFQARLQQPEPTTPSDLLLSRDQRALLINVHFRQPSTVSAAYNTEVTQAVRRVIRELALDPQGFHVGLTGSYVYGAESQAAILRDTDKTTIITIVGVSLLFVLILGRLFYPLLASLPVFMSLLLTMAFVRLSVGSLNLLTTFLPPLALGMGIDYGIQFITHFLEARRGGQNLTKALYSTMLQKGNAMLIAALATSATLFGLLTASSPGLQQMGLILGVGVLLACLLTLLVLPSLIVVAHLVLRRRFRGLPPRYTLNVRPVVHGLLRAPWIVIVIVLAASIYVGLTSASRVGFEFVSDKLVPRNLPTNQTRAEIDRAFEQGSSDTQNYFLFFVNNDVNQIQSVSQRLATIPAIDQVLNYYSKMPLPTQLDEIKAKLSQVRALNLESALAPARAQFQWLQGNLAHQQDLRAQLDRLQQNMIKAQQQADLNGQEPLAKAFGEQHDRAADVESRLGHLDTAALSAQVDAVNQKLNQLAQDVQAILGSIPTAQEIEDRLHDPQLQLLLQSYFFTSDGKMIIYAHVKPEWTLNDNLYQQFIGQISAISDDYLGTPMLQARLRDYMASDFQRSTLLAIVVIMLIIWFDFRKAGLRGATFFALAPLILGYTWMLAVMHWMGIEFNFVNIVISPLLLGLGVDNCVYLLHRHHDLRQRDVERATSSTAVPIIANALAAMIGLGSLTLAETSALQVLGEVSLLGIGFTTLFSLTFLPAVLSLLVKRD